MAHASPIKKQDLVFTGSHAKGLNPSVCFSVQPYSGLLRMLLYGRFVHWQTYEVPRGRGSMHLFNLFLQVNFLVMKGMHAKL